jgi:hypothetical protein
MRVINGIGWEWIGSMSKIIVIESEGCYGKGKGKGKMTNGNASAAECCGGFDN